MAERDELPISRPSILTQSSRVALELARSASALGSSRFCFCCGCAATTWGDFGGCPMAGGFTPRPGLVASRRARSKPSSSRHRTAALFVGAEPKVVTSRRAEGAASVANSQFPIPVSQSGDGAASPPIPNFKHQTSNQFPIPDSQFPTSNFKPIPNSKLRFPFEVT